MRIHVMPDNSDFRHYAFVSEETDIEIHFSETMQLTHTVIAGIYGFTNKEARDKFVSRVNRAKEEGTAAHIADLATEAVA
jgi:hypothetical protein